MFSMQKYGGITKYFCELMKNLPPEHQFNLSVLLSDNQHLKEDFKVFRKLNIPLPDRESRLKLIIKKRLYDVNKIYTNYTIKVDSYDLFHPTYYDTYFLNKIKKPYVITVHDLIEFKFKEFFATSSLIPQMEQVIKKANRIISISENTKKDLIEIFKINPEKIDVIYHGFNKPLYQTKKNTFGRYILFVGRRGVYKNFEIFVKAVSVLLNKQNELKLICVGDPFKKEEINLLRSLKISERAITLGVNEKELNNLYSNALVFVYPTLYEGFGMPILEAFANNCPVCLSNTSSLPEIAGDAGVYFDPTDQESILNAVERIIFDNDFAKKLVNSGRKRLLNFSWKKTAEETITSYKKVIT